METTEPYRAHSFNPAKATFIQGSRNDDNPEWVQLEASSADRFKFPPLTPGAPYTLRLVEGVDEKAVASGKLAAYERGERTVTVAFRNEASNNVLFYRWTIEATHLTDLFKGRFVSGQEYSLFVKPLD